MILVLISISVSVLFFQVFINVTCMYGFTYLDKILVFVKHIVYYVILLSF
jgi:hypothetical protein